MSDVLAAPVSDPRADLKQALGRQRRREVATALAFAAPLILFMLAIFIVPIVSLLLRAVWTPEVRDALTRTAPALQAWDGHGLPASGAYLALVQDLHAAREGGAIGKMALRLEFEQRGYRTLLLRTSSAVGKVEDTRGLTPEAARDLLTKADARWGQIAYWQLLQRAASPLTGSYLLASVDLRQTPSGAIERVPDDQAVYVRILGRTFLISGVCTLVCLLLGYPMAYWLTTLPPRRLSLAMMLILIPFWSSVLVRVASWMVLLQREGLVNGLLRVLHLTSSPVDLLFNRLGVYISMVHILLPVMVLPLYSVMKDIPASYQRAAVSLGSHPFEAFWRVYVPQTVPGVAAGSLLVFIMALGYYIAPNLLGGAGDQMLSYYVAYYTNQAMNWSLACALGALLLAATAATYLVFLVLRRLCRAVVA